MGLARYQQAMHERHRRFRLAAPSQVLNHRQHWSGRQGHVLCPALHGRRHLHGREQSLHACEPCRPCTRQASFSQGRCSLGERACPQVSGWVGNRCLWHVWEPDLAGADPIRQRDQPGQAPFQPAHRQRVLRARDRRWLEHRRHRLDKAAGRGRTSRPEHLRAGLERLGLLDGSPMMAGQGAVELQPPTVEPTVSRVPRRQRGRHQVCHHVAQQGERQGVVPRPWRGLIVRIKRAQCGHRPMRLHLGLKGTGKLADIVQRHQPTQRATVERKSVVGQQQRNRGYVESMSDKRVRRRR